MTASEPAAPGGMVDGEDGRPHCHLLVEAGENKRLLVNWLEPSHRITNGDRPEQVPERFDLCIVDRTHYLEHTSLLRARKRAADPEFLPVLLIASATDQLRTDADVWEVVDDVVETPIGQAELAARIENLIQRRGTARRLAERERKLAATVSELELKERAMDAAPVGVTLLDPSDERRPIIYANAAFERITGYDRGEVLGRNMAFLEGPDTDRGSVGRIKSALVAEEQARVTLLNYRRNGSRFWNRVEVAPVYDEDDDLIAHVSFQTDVTDETIREQRLTVLNRVMRHNLSNDLNVIEGYANLIRESGDSAARHAAIDHILDSTGDLQKLSRTASWIEQVLGRCRERSRLIDLTEEVSRVCAELEAAYPATEVDLDIDGGPWQVRGSFLGEALRELVENAAKHSDDGAAVVEVTVGPHWGLDDHVMITVADDGPGIPGNTVQVLRRGEETQLNHGDGLGLWLVYWVVTLIGGSIDVDCPASGGSVITLTLPTSDPEAT